MSIVLDGTSGITTPDVDSTADISVNGLTVGRGAGAVSTNTAVGASALAATASGGSNTGIGYLALTALTSGSDNTSVGRSSLASNTTGANNVGLGVQALNSNTTASNNTAVGYQAGYTATGGNNTFVGQLAGYAVTSGDYNICVGRSAGNGATPVTTGTQNIILGYYTSLSAGSNSSSIVIGASGSGTTGKGSNTGFINPDTGGVYQGNNSSTWSTTSDRRLKKNIVDNTEGLDKINAIQVRNFEYRLPDEVDPELKPADAIKRPGVQLGVIAQELQAVLPECVKQESTGVLSVDTDNLTWYLINAVKQLKAEIDILRGQA